MSVLIIVLRMTICESLVAEPGSFTVVIEMIRNIFSVAFKPYKTSFPCPGAPTQQSIKMLYARDNIDNNYNAVAHIYISERPYVFYHILILFIINNFLFCNSSIIFLLCVAIVLSSCLLLYNEKE